MNILRFRLASIAGPPVPAAPDTAADRADEKLLVVLSV
jgi:hypothetical protein